MVPASVWVEDEKQSPPVKDANLSRALVTLFFFLFFLFFSQRRIRSRSTSGGDCGCWCCGPLTHIRAASERE